MNTWESTLKFVLAIVIIWLVIYVIDSFLKWKGFSILVLVSSGYLILSMCCAVTKIPSVIKEGFERDQTNSYAAVEEMFIPTAPEEDAGSITMVDDLINKIEEVSGKNMVTKL